MISCHFRTLVLLFASLFVAALAMSVKARAVPLQTLDQQDFSGTSLPLLQIAEGDLRPRQVRRKLRDQGYRDIEFIDRRLPTYIARACRDGRRFRLHIDRNGTLDRKKRIGRCGRDVRPSRDVINPPRDRRRSRSLPQIRTILRDRGYRDIEFIDRRLPTYVARACHDNRRFRLNINRYGVIGKQKRIGRCGRDIRAPRDDRHRMRPAQIRQMLRDKGFDEISFLDRRLPIYVVQACKRNRRMKMRIDRFGEIVRRDRLGRCRSRQESGMKPPQVRQALQARGFSRIIFTDHKLPVYVVEACRRGDKFRLRLNRFAKIKRQSRIGRCQMWPSQRNYTRREVADILRRRGYRELDFFDRTAPRFGLVACRRGQKFRMRVNEFAEIKKRRRIGFCRPPVSAPPVQHFDIEIDEEELRGSGRIDPETCQNYLDTLVRRHHIHFDVNSASLRRRSFDLLRRLARVMNRCQSSRIEISGHTDSDGSRDYNRDLSRRRARTVVSFLGDEGISRRRMTAFGYGEDQPVMRYERTEADKARNRRIEFTVNWGEDEDEDVDYRR